MTPAPRLSRKQREFLQRKGEILDAAEAVFAAKGFLSATMEEIAQRAEFAVGTLYRFFASKNSLYEETVRSRIERMETELNGSLEADESPHEKIASYFRCRLNQFWENPRFFRLFYQGTSAMVMETRAGFLPEIMSRYEKLLRDVEQAFREGIAKGQFRPVEPRLLTTVLEGTIRSYVVRLSREVNPVRNLKEEETLLDLFQSGAT